MTTNVPILQVDDIEVLYEQTILAVRSVSLEVAKGRSWCCWAPTARVKAPR